MRVWVSASASIVTLSVVQAMKRATGAASKERARFRSALVVTQVAAAVTLLAVAGLVVQTFLTLLPSSPGFTTESRAAFIWSISERQFPDATDRRRRVNDRRRGQISWSLTPRSTRWRGDDRREVEGSATDADRVLGARNRHRTSTLRG